MYLILSQGYMLSIIKKNTIEDRALRVLQTLGKSISSYKQKLLYFLEMEFLNAFDLKMTEKSLVYEKKSTSENLSLIRKNNNPLQYSIRNLWVSRPRLLPLRHIKRDPL